MALSGTSYRMPGAEHASHPTQTLPVRSQRVRRQVSWARTALRRFLASVVNGSDHPCWQTNDVTTQLALLPPRERNRLLDSGRATTKR